MLASKVCLVSDTCAKKARNSVPLGARNTYRAVNVYVKASSKLVTKRSEERFTEALDLLPGGVKSPVRAFRFVGGKPIVFERVKGARCFNVDGNKYIDYVGSRGPAIMGHANEVNAAICKQVEKGTSFGAPCELENVLAKAVIARVPSVEMVRFCSSGTETCLSVLRLMRACTARDGLIKFVGCYHGHADSSSRRDPASRRSGCPTRQGHFKPAIDGSFVHRLYQQQQQRDGESPVDLCGCYVPVVSAAAAAAGDEALLRLDSPGFAYAPAIAAPVASS